MPFVPVSMLVVLLTKCCVIFKDVLANQVMDIALLLNLLYSIASLVGKVIIGTLSDNGKIIYVLRMIVLRKGLVARKPA